MSLLGKKCQDIWNKPGGPRGPSGLLFSGVCISPLFQSIAAGLCFRVFASGTEPGRYERENMVNLMQWQETLYKMFMEKDEGIMFKKETVTKTDLLKVLDLMEASGIQYWLDGGWGVDVLVGKQTREHRDVDINFDARCTDVLLDALVFRGYEIVTDWRPVRIELYHPELSYVDIHPFVISGDTLILYVELPELPEPPELGFLVTTGMAFSVNVHTPVNFTVVPSTAVVHPLNDHLPLLLFFSAVDVEFSSYF